MSLRGAGVVCCLVRGGERVGGEEVGWCWGEHVEGEGGEEGRHHASEGGVDEKGRNKEMRMMMGHAEYVAFIACRVAVGSARVR